MYRKQLVRILVFFVFVSGTLAMAGLAGNEPAAVRQVEDFSRFKIGTFPEGWKSRGGDASQVYRVRANQESYLEAKAINSAVTIAKEFEYDLRAYPFLTWQWRVIQCPKGGDERYKKTGDSAAAIYVIFPALFRPNNIKYVWSASLPIGTTTESPYSSKTKIIVLRNQSSPLGTWVSEKVNVYEDYKRLFGHEPEQVKAIGLMSDSDNTKSRSEAHYKKISISRQ
ncbi:MAG: DUF3047 domain-containing protein [Deltaproteobacteria bacterium]|nr:DUF3047 domain-containing protein [Deltaproteobacteria bacterium]MBW2073850.1 DUF3047 domain-containing protein [Deltaproteobacteria bacterium]RLB83106.1 MAG: hypothetical protein DRH17_03365 [Deltaproteobacteria bacterium]